VLNNRERRIFEGRRLAENPITLAELADEFGVSRERVRQIDVRSFEKVQKAVKNRVARMDAPAPPRHIGFQFSPVVDELADGSVTIDTFYRNRTTQKSLRAPVANQ
jgi:orotate phosphoribosyltransferase-like protein